MPTKKPFDPYKDFSPHRMEGGMPAYKSKRAQYQGGMNPHPEAAMGKPAPRTTNPRKR
jgi:hypothetical protein